MEDCVSATQSTLGKAIKRPPMTTKLLSKPPFRFLHDCVTECIKTYGFLDGLFNSKEMDSKNVTERGEKIKFLKKAIAAVALVTGENLVANPKKIVAGQDAENTNKFLQALGQCCIDKVDSSQAVESILNDGPKMEDSAKKERTSKSRSRGRSSERQDERDRSRERRSRSREKSNHGKEMEKDKEREEVDIASKNSEKQIERSRQDRPGTAKGERQKRLITKPPEEDKPHTPDSLAAPQSNSVSENPNPRAEEDKDLVYGLRKVTRTRRERPSSATARAGPPRIKTNINNGENNPIIDTSAQPASNVIEDNSETKNVDGDPDDEFEVQQAVSFTEPEDIAKSYNDLQDDDGGEDEKGHLLAKIDAMKNAIKKEDESETNQQKHVDEATNRREREQAQQEVNTLREAIQVLCRSANPLGKIMDYVQEDLDAMRKEKENWKEENEKHEEALAEERIITENALSPLRAVLRELEQQIIDQTDAISTAKNNILENDQKIQQLLDSVAGSN
eukprot:UC4_evm3s507